MPAVLPASVAEDGSWHPRGDRDAEIAAEDVLGEGASEPHLDCRVGAQALYVARAETLHLAYALWGELLQESLVGEGG